MAPYEYGSVRTSCAFRQFHICTSPSIRHTAIWSPPCCSVMERGYPPSITNSPARARRLTSHRRMRASRPLEMSIASSGEKTTDFANL